MGVSGSGKTTVGKIVASRLGWRFEEGDLLHSQTAIDKMKSGRPLTDRDRLPWLDRVADWVDEQVDAGLNGVITCSALKRAYRDLINRRGHDVLFVFLSGPKELIAARLASRHGHFMPASLLDSQFQDLEPPQPDEPAITVDIKPPPEATAQEIIDRVP